MDLLVAIAALVIGVVAGITIWYLLDERRRGRRGERIDIVRNRTD